MDRDFHLGDILTVTTGRLVSPRLMDGLYDILNYMTNDNLFTHQLPRASDECAPYLLKQHPYLAAVAPPDFPTQDAAWEWLNEQVAIFGERLPVSPIPLDAHTYKHPVQELVEMVGPERVIVADTTDNREEAGGD
jgi:hypothetical protein